MPKVLRPKDPIPTELFTLKGTRFMWNRRGNSRYARAGLDAQIKAHLIDNPGEKITTLPAALYMGHNPKKPLSAHERYTLSASIRNMAKRAQSELKCSMPRRHGGDSTGIPSNADRVILQRLQGRRKVNVIKAIADVAVELGGRVVSPSKLETVAKTLPTDRRPELIGSHDWNNATKNAIRTSLHARGIMPIFFEHKGRSSIRDA
ncbi:MAG TPA: hypothetical protein HA254_04540 [Candidatus Diapherotrites archaeon]|uniref:Uncharacterized protein n=1 Tax=Candidatus Iainarchaeum sp. TaxID=3101447 RepID=A0A7J4IWL0_9ARCH|nr:hypothetical protein [Candidatus Diapherotrites archaeon]